jgi:hypothetical protein
MGPLLVFFGKKLSDAIDIFTLRYEDMQRTTMTHSSTGWLSEKYQHWEISYPGGQHCKQINPEWAKFHQTPPTKL